MQDLETLLKRDVIEPVYSIKRFRGNHNQPLTSVVAQKQFKQVMDHMDDDQVQWRQVIMI